MLEVTLYTKTDCGLCDEVKAELAKLTAVYPHWLIEVDITQDREIYGRYRYTIPVIHIGQTKLHAPITTTALEMALKEAVTSM